MITKRDSITSLLDWMIDKVVIGSTKAEVTESESIESLAFSESSSTQLCRICYDTTEYPIIYPCRCKGTMGAIHLPCLERWLEEGNRSSCELCGYRFDVERTPRYRAVHSIFVWLFLKRNEHELYVRSIRVDIIRCMVITPLTLGSSYVCIVAADFYSTNKYDNFPPARWTTYSLLAMMILLVFSYFVWMYATLQYHQKVWFFWWQKTSSVRLRHHHTSTGDVSRSPTMYRTKMSHGISPV